MEGFPEGNYDIKLIFSRAKKNSLIEKGIIDSEKEILNLSPIKLSSNYIDFKKNEMIFQKINIKPLEINYDEFQIDDEILKIFSGTDLNYIQFELRNKDKNIIFHTELQEIIDFYLKILDSILDPSKMKFESVFNLSTTRARSSNHQTENCQELKNKNCSNSNLYINIFFEFDEHVRKSILERIFYIFKLSISYRTLIENNLSCLIKYFKKYRENIINTLEKANYEENTSYCSNCLIF